MARRQPHREPPPGQGPDGGLRERKKARRRREILRAAARLFDRQGIDATTLADIARAIGVSPPTVTNYFGAKENILSALIFEGTEKERTQHRARPRRTGIPFAEVVGDLLAECSANTLRIAGKRVWRYAEAANIRAAGTAFQARFRESDRLLRELIAEVLGDYAIVLRSGKAPDLDLLAKLFFDRWTAHYLDYIRDDTMSRASHEAALRQDVAAMVDLIFDARFAAASPLRRPR